MSVRQEIADERFQKVSVNWAKLKQQTWQQLLLRFAFGAGIATAASLAGDLFGQRFGGLFLAFPAILPAALTMVERQEGEGKADVDATGAAFGRSGYDRLRLHRQELDPAARGSLGGGSRIVWLALAVGLFVLVRGQLKTVRAHPGRGRH